MFERTIAHVLFGIVLILSLLILAAADGALLARSDPRVEPQVWTELAQRDRAEVLMLLEPPPDLGPAYRLPTKAARGRWVYETLRTHALRQQEPLTAWLQARGIPHRRFWSVNAVAAVLDAESLRAVLARPEVRRILADTPFRGVAPWPASPLTAAETATIPWGVQRVEAPWAWAQGYTGAGIVIAGQDTGYAWQHEALQRRYRGYHPADGSADHDYNWHDSIHEDIPPLGDANACGYSSPEPCDDGLHGTHTMGTMVGNNGPMDAPGWPAAADRAIGVAPGAVWIGCRNMDNGWGRPSTYIECFEWLMAPYPRGGDPLRDGDPSKAPDVISNSWGCPPSEGCTSEHLAAIEPAVNAADAAGILIVVSAGNDGPRCSTVNHPPAIYPRSFTVGATTADDQLASFSSRGPVSYGGQTLRKPDVSAPGVAVLSAIPGDLYGNLSGTSMAAPHVAGVAALVLQAAPSLRGDTAMLKAILQATADPIISFTCGGADVDGSPNNLFGWGIVNARRAIASLAQEGFLAGYVTDDRDVALKGALVTIRDRQGVVRATTTTDAQGAYSVTLAWGAYAMEVYRLGYEPATVAPVFVVGGQTTTQSFRLRPLPTPTPTETPIPTATPTPTFTPLPLTQPVWLPLLRR
jgi:subtilisin family serine protease